MSLRALSARWPLWLLVSSALVVASWCWPALLGRATWAERGYQTRVVPARLAAGAALGAGQVPAWWDEAGLGAPLVGRAAHGALYPPYALATSGQALSYLELLHLVLLCAATGALARRALPPPTDEGGGRASTVAIAGAAVVPLASGWAERALVSGQLAALAWAALAVALGAARGSVARAATVACVAASALAGSPALAALAALAVVVAEGRRAGWRAACRRGAIVLGGAAALAGAQLAPAALESAWRVGAEGSTVAPGPLATATLLGAVALAWIGPARRGLWGALALAALGAAALVMRGRGAPLQLAGFELAPDAVIGLGVVLVAAAAAAGANRLAAMASTMSSARRTLLLGALVALAALAVAALATPLGGGARWVARAEVDELPRWAEPGAVRGALAAPVPPGAPLRVFCPAPPSAAEKRVRQRWQEQRGGRDDGRQRSGIDVASALADPAGALASAAGLGAGWACVPARGEAAGALADELWRRGAGLGGRLLQRWSISLALVPSSTVVAAGFRELRRLGAWSLVEVSVRPRAATYRAVHAVRGAAEVVAAVMPEPGAVGAGASELVIETAGAPAPVATSVAGPAAGPVAGASPGAALPPGDEPPSGDEPHGYHHPRAGAEPPLEGAGAPAAARGAAPPEPCTIDRWRPGVIDLRCPGGGVAALAVAWHPGWQVTVDGVAARALRAEGAVVAVAVPQAGEHAVRWRFSPAGSAAGGWIAAAALAALAAALISALRAARRATK